MIFPRRIERKIKKSLSIIGTLLLMNVVLSFFVTTFNIWLVLLAGVSVAIIVYAHYFEKVKKGVHIMIGVISIIPVSIMLFLAIYGNIDTAQFDEDAVIVLGAGIRGEAVTPILANRLDRAIEYHRKNPNAIIIVCGGQGRGRITEALAMTRYLAARGVSAEKIIQEDRSRTTFQNLSFAKNILTEHFPEGFTSVIITNDFHMYRAMRIARELGMPSRRMGAATTWYIIPINFFRETAAVLRMWILPSRAFCKIQASGNIEEC